MIKKLQQTASNSRLSVKDINIQLNTGVSDSTVLRAIKDNKSIMFKKMIRTPCLTSKHKDSRFRFALEHVLWTEMWKSIIFSDEKKFNLDGPDGYKYYWHHLNMKEITYSKRIQGGGGLMVWVGFCNNEKLTIQFIDIKMNSEAYCNMLKTPLKCFIDENKEKEYIFQQDNAPCHRAKKTTAWFLETNINLMTWPALSPDLNPVENIWSDMSRMVYSNGQQYHTIQSLKTA
ncbi:Transposable element Tc3 transposase, partial [Nosema granulosis]